MSLLKTNEIQNYNGSSLTLTASTVSTSAQLNTGGNISVTGSLNVSDDSTTRTNLGLGTIATQDSDSIAVTGGSATLGALTVSGSDSGNLVRITQTGSGNALVVEDSANPDSTPFVVDSSGNVGVGTSSPGVELEVDGDIRADGIYGQADTNTSIQFPGSDVITFNEGGSEVMRINSSGDVLVGCETSPSATVGGSGFIDSSNGRNSLYLSTLSTGSQGIAYFWNPNGLVGQIITNGSATSYATSSDYRLKENITEITDGITRVKRLNPSRFNFIADPDKIVDGFIAHEVQDIVPEAVAGEKDAVDSDGKPEYQGVDYGRITPLLTAALKEAIEKIEMLEARIAVLEAK